jgi:hypothetical protein
LRGLLQDGHDVVGLKNGNAEAFDATGETKGGTTANSERVAVDEVGL